MDKFGLINLESLGNDKIFIKQCVFDKQYQFACTARFFNNILAKELNNDYFREL